MWILRLADVEYFLLNCYDFIFITKNKLILLTIKRGIFKEIFKVIIVFDYFQILIQL